MKKLIISPYTLLKNRSVFSNSEEILKNPMISQKYSTLKQGRVR